MTDVVHPNAYLLVPRPTTRFQGPDRTPWDVVGEAYWARRLPRDLRTYYEQMMRRRWCSWPTTRSLDIATALADYSTRMSGESWEIVGIFSPCLAALETASCSDAEGFSRVGVDVVSVGEWSLLRALEEAPHVIVPLERLLNQYGLLSDSRDVPLIVRSHAFAVQARWVEEIADPATGYGIEAVDVFFRGGIRP